MTAAHFFYTFHRYSQQISGFDYPLDRWFVETSIYILRVAN